MIHIVFIHLNNGMKTRSNTKELVFTHCRFSLLNYFHAILFSEDVHEATRKVVILKSVFVICCGDFFLNKFTVIFLKNNGNNNVYYCKASDRFVRSLMPRREWMQKFAYRTNSFLRLDNIRDHKTIIFNDDYDDDLSLSQPHGMDLSCLSILSVSKNEKCMSATALLKLLALKNANSNT